jgi:hypothetical protein
MTDLWIFKESGFQDGKYVTQSDSNLSGSGYDNEISSLRIAGGEVEFFEGPQGQGESWTLGPGSYDTVELISLGIQDDSISSFYL